MQYNVIAYVWNIDFTAWKKWWRKRREPRVCSNLGPIISHGFSHASYQSQSWSFVCSHPMYSHRQAMPMAVYKAICICYLLPVTFYCTRTSNQSMKAPTRTLKTNNIHYDKCVCLDQWLLTVYKVVPSSSSHSLIHSPPHTHINIYTCFKICMFSSLSVLVHPMWPHHHLTACVPVWTSEFPFSALTSASRNQLSVHLWPHTAMHAFNITSRFQMAIIFCSHSSSSIFCASIPSAIFSSIFLSLPRFASKSFYFFKYVYLHIYSVIQTRSQLTFKLHRKLLTKAPLSSCWAYALSVWS